MDMNQNKKMKIMKWMRKKNKRCNKIKVQTNQKNIQMNMKSLMTKRDSL